MSDEFSSVDASAWSCAAVAAPPEFPRITLGKIPKNALRERHKELYR